MAKYTFIKIMTKSGLLFRTNYKHSSGLFLLFALASMQEASPFKTGLLAANPENGGDSHHQHHQIFN